MYHFKIKECLLVWTNYKIIVLNIKDLSFKDIIMNKD